MIVNDRRFFTALSIAALLGVLTLNAEAVTSIVSNRLIAPLQIGLVYMLTPGLFCAAMTGSLIPGALVNLAIWFLIACLFLRPFRKRPATLKT